MGDNSLFGNTIELASKALDLRSRRHEVIISNIANADTPGYKAFDLYVDEALSRQTSAEGGIALERSNPGHIPAHHSAGAGGSPKEIQLSSQVTLRGDGNTVDMEREMSNLAANQLMYRASAQILSKKFQSLRSVIKGSSQ